MAAFIVAAVAAAAILLIFIGLTAGRGVGRLIAPRALRLGGRKEDARRRRRATARSATSWPTAPRWRRSTSAIEERDFGANLARELARADLKLKVSEYIMFWVGCTLGVPAIMFLLSPFFPTLGNPLFLLIGGVVGFFIPRFWLSPPQGRPAERLQQAAGRHHHAHRQRAARRLVVPAGHRDGRARDAAADLDRVRARHPRGQPRPALRRRAGQHGPPRPLRRPGADGHGHHHPAPGRRQPGRDPRLDRLHHPRARAHQGRDPDPDRPAAHVGLRGRLPAHRPVSACSSSSRRSSWSPCS